MAMSDLLDQLLKERETGMVVDRTAVIEPTAPPVPHGELSDYAFDMDHWSKRQGERLTSRRKDQPIYADCHHALFDPNPVLAEQCSSPMRSAWFSDLVTSEDYIALHAQTQLDAGLSEVSAVKLAEAYLDYAKEQNGEEGAGGGEGIQGDIDRMRSINCAIELALEDASDAQDAAMAMGEEPDENGKIEAKQLAKCFKLIRKDHKLREIFEMAGRFRCFARAAQRAKVKHGYDDMIGVRMSDDVPSLITAELARMTDPDLELDLLRRIVEKQAICREYQGEQKQGQGPIIVYCDESASMDDCVHGRKKIVKAKALCLALGWVAQQQKRWIAFVSFDDKKEGERLCMPRGKWDQEKLVNWIKNFSYGGTRLDCLLETLPDKYWTDFSAPEGKTDVIVITDGQVHANPTQVERFNRWKKQRHAKCFGLIVDSAPGGLAEVCDRYWMLGDLSIMEKGVQEMLSI